jgi:putative ABC transport system permease protein
LRNPGIAEVAAASGVPGRFGGDNAHRPEDAPAEVVYSLQTLGVSFDYLNTMGMQLTAGRDFSPAHPTDSTEAFIINETAARVMGWEPQTAVGKHLTALGTRNDERTIVGVVKDFHFESLHLEIKPLVMSIDPLSFIYIAVRLRPQNVSESLSFLQEKWQAYEPGYPWRYFFLDEDFGRLFAREERQSQIFGTFTILAIVIACLGLFGLASFVAEQRTQEIGIRKVLGASLAGIVGLLSKDFVKLVLVANVIAWPVAYVAIQHWLQNFAYRVEIGWEVFVLAGGIALLIALLTVSVQALKAALANPVESLRYE